MRQFPPKYMLLRCQCMVNYCSSIRKSAVSTTEECAGLCAQVDECDVWTFWPSGTASSDGNLSKPKCDLCPVSLGGSFDREQDYCNNGDCGACWEPYDLTAAQGIPDDAEYSCQDARLWFEQGVGCCNYDETKAAYQVPATCELYRAVPNHANVLAYGLEAITGPKDCSSTVWLPFLEPIHSANDAVSIEEDPLEPVVVNHTLKGFCDMCPEEYGFVLLPTKQVCYEDGSCGVCLDSYNAVKDGLIESGVHSMVHYLCRVLCRPRESRCIHGQRSRDDAKYSPRTLTSCIRWPLVLG